MKKIFPLLLLLFLVNILEVFAQDGENVNLLQLPEQLANRLGIGLTAAKLLCCIIFTLMFFLPIAMFSRRNVILCLFSGIILLGFFIALGWLDVWFMLILILIVAVMFSGKIKEWIT